MSVKNVCVDGHAPDDLKRYAHLSQRRNDPLQIIDQRIHTLLKQEIYPALLGRFGKKLLKRPHTGWAWQAEIPMMGCDSIIGGWERDGWLRTIGVWAGLWLVWGIVFYRYTRGSPDAVTRAVSWLLKGSVLDLLVAAPRHIMLRHRDECSAPAVTSFGITTGIAVTLLSFGPSVLLLYKKRLDAHSSAKHGEASGAIPGA